MKIKILNKTKTEAVHKHTGRHWDQWASSLKKEDVSHLTHKELVAHLKKKYKLTPWWQQVVATGFEILVGKRKEGQNHKGEYAVTATKTFPISQKKMWNWLASSAGIEVWLKPMSPFELKEKAQYEVEGGIFGEVRTMKKPERARLTWIDDEMPKKMILQFAVIARDEEKCLLFFQHDHLATPLIKERYAQKWKSVLAEIENFFKKV